MEQILGVVVKLFVEEREWRVAEDGYVGKFAAGVKTRIEANVEAGFSIYGIAVDGNKSIVLKKDWALRLPAEERTGGKLYRHEIVIEETAEKVPSTRYLFNHLSLLRLFPDGHTELWEIALISQEGDFFLTVQRVYVVRCYLTKDRIACPFFEKSLHVWPQFVEFMEKLFLESDMRLDGFTPLDAYQPEPEFPQNDLNPYTGRTLWWNHARRWGLIATSEGIARVHFSRITPRNRLIALEEGELVKYATLRTPVHPDSTSIKWEAVGVKQFLELRR